MWSYFVVRRTFVRSLRAKRRASRPTLPVSAVSSAEDHHHQYHQYHQHRFLSVGSGDGKWKPPGQGGPSHKGRQSNRKENFDKKFLQPAARGELVHKHDSGIPRLAARKHKAKIGPPQGRPRYFREDEGEGTTYWDEMEEEEEEGIRGNRFETVSPGSSKAITDEGIHDFNTLLDESDLDYYAPSLIQDDKYYWLEEDYEEWGASKEEMAELLDEDGFLHVEYTKDDVLEGPDKFGDASAELQDKDDDVEEFEREGSKRKSDRIEEWEYKDPEYQFFYGQNDVFEIAASDEKQFGDGPASVENDMVLPLRDHGPELDDFLEAMIEHPTKYAQVASHRLHPDSTREPKPIVPKNRAQPPKEFVESFARFLYVSGLPPLEVDGEVGDLANPIHRNLLQQTIARLVGVNSERVYPANTTSGFVGFDSPKDLASALAAGPTEQIVSSSPSISFYRDSGEDCEFAKVAPDCTLELSNIPPGNSPSSLLQRLFPEDTEVGVAYGTVSPEDVYFLSATNVLIRFSSEEQAESAVASPLVHEQLKELGQYRIRYFRARRELLHAGFVGPNKSHENRKMGPRLIVDGDMPTKKFFISHARVIHLRNLDMNLTKKGISAAFQPFSTRRRDVYGSIEFVTCEAGIPTGCAYVGFDTPGEAEAAVRALNGIMQLGDRRSNLSLVKDRQIPGKPLVRPEKRLERNVEELLDDLNNWEKYVVPEDLKILEDAGISKDVLDDALRGIRYNNATFGVLDSALRSEALEPQKMTGELYKELVEMYISTLKDCIATPENVGAMYEALHFPDEPIDLSIFDREKERQKELAEKRAALYGAPRS